MGTPLVPTNNTAGFFLSIASTGQDIGDLITGTAPETGPLITSSPTDSTTTLTGAIQQNSGTAATSVGIGQGKINAGGNCTFQSKVSIGQSAISQTLTVTDASNPTIELKRGGTSVGFLANGSSQFGVGGLVDLAINANAAGNKVLIGSGGVVAITTAAGAASLGTPATTFIGNVIAGVQTGLAAIAGQVGEVISANLSVYTNLATTATYQQVTTVALTPGDWDITWFGSLAANGATLTITANAIFALSTTTASAAGATEGLGDIAYVSQVLNATSGRDSVMGHRRVNISTATSYFLNAQSTFSVGNPQIVGSIVATRIR